MKRLLLMLCAGLSAAACTQDSPTDAGGGLLPSNSIESFEVILSPDMYLVMDTAFGFYSEASNAEFTLLAHEYDGSLNSRVLVRYQLPRTIVLFDTLGVLRVDSMPRFFEGSVRVQIDTVNSTPPSAQLELYRTTEDWDRASATWQLRVDTSGVQLPWSQAGGSPGTHLSTAVYEESDSVLLAVDSATLAIWADTLDTTRGAVIDVSTPGIRIRAGLPILRVKARSPMNPDTVVELSVAPGRTFIFEPEQPDSIGVPRVGGTPAWRTILRLRDRLDTLTIACPGVPGCAIRLGDASFNYIAFQLQPVPSPAGFAPETPLTVALHALLPSPLVPLERSPLTGAVGFVLNAIPVASFVNAGAPVAELPATDFMRIAFARPDPSQPVRPSHVALLQAGARTFGFGTFQPMPSLRIIVSRANAVQLP